MEIKTIIKDLFQKLLLFLNIKPDGNQKYLLIVTMIVGLLGTYSSPTITKEVISSLPAQWIAIQALVSSVCGLLTGMIWKGKFRAGAIKYFAIFAISESLCGFFLCMYLTFIEYNVWVFAITNLIYMNLITRFVGKCIMAFKAKLWVEKEREIYDNNCSVVGSIVCIFGFFLALVALPPLKLAIALVGIECLIDDVGWLYVYFKNRETIVEENEE